MNNITGRHITGNSTEFNSPSGCTIIGNGNTINNGINCTIIGNGNMIKYSNNTSVSGNGNVLKHCTRVNVTGNGNMLDGCTDITLLGNGNVEKNGDTVRAKQPRNDSRVSGNFCDVFVANNVEAVNTNVPVIDCFNFGPGNIISDIYTAGVGSQCINMGRDAQHFRTNPSEVRQYNSNSQPNLNIIRGDVSINYSDSSSSVNNCRKVVSEAPKESVLPKEEASDVVKTSVEELQCPICLDNKKNGLIQCGHAFCLPCVRKIHNDHNPCPLCKAEITKVTKMYI